METVLPDEVEHFPGCNRNKMEEICILLISMKHGDSFTR